MLQADTPDDFVLATGRTETVRDFTTNAFKCVGIDLEWKGDTGTISEYGIDKASGKTLVKVDQQYFRPAEVELLIGDPSKAKEKLGWQAKITLEQMAAEVVESDLALLK